MLKLLALSTLAIAPMCSQAAMISFESAEKSFTQIAKNCVDVDLTTWKHPTRAALIDHEFKIKKVQICNDGKYPVFYGEPKGNPSAPSKNTNDYFAPLYESVLKANGRWPYSLVYQRDHWAVSVSANKGAPGLTINEENYDDPTFVDPK